MEVLQRTGSSPTGWEQRDESSGLPPPLTNIQHPTSIFVMCVWFKFADFQRRQRLLQHLTLKQILALSKLEETLGSGTINTSQSSSC